jgi:hypothetical protein
MFHFCKSREELNALYDQLSKKIDSHSDEDKSLKKLVDISYISALLDVMDMCAEIKTPYK